MARLSIGDTAKPFNLLGSDSKKHLLADYSGRSVIALIFTCNHCPYAQAWEDRLIRLQSDYAGRDVQLLAVNSNDPNQYPEDSYEKMKERVEEKGFNFPYLHDGDQSLARDYGAERTPEVFLFDGEGTLRYHGAIDDNYEDSSAVQQDYLRDAIEAVLDGRDPETAETELVGCSLKWKRHT